MRAARRLPAIAFPFLILLGAFTACSGGGNPCEIPDDLVNEDGVSVGVAFDIGGIGDKSFNDAAKRGFDQAVDEGLISEATCIEPNESGSNRDENLLALADDGFDLVFGIGFAFSPAVNENAGNYPDQQFADHRRVRDVSARRLRGHPQPGSAERHRPDVQGRGGLLPGRRGGGHGSAEGEL